MKVRQAIAALLDADMDADLVFWDHGFTEVVEQVMVDRGLKLVYLGSGNQSSYRDFHRAGVELKPRVD